MAETPTRRGVSQGLVLLLLFVWPAGCFITYTRPVQEKLRPAGERSRCVNRPLQHRLHYCRHRRGALETHLSSGGIGASLVGSRRQTKCLDTCAREGVRLFAARGEVAEVATDDAKGNEIEIDGNYTPEELEFIRNFHAECEAAEGPGGEDGGEGEDELAPYDSDYRMYAGEGSTNVEWNAAMGVEDSWDLPPFEDFDPLVPLEHHEYSGEYLQANLKSEINPFPLHSSWVDRDIKVGDIDEDKKEAIEPMMSVIEQVCELIDTTDDVFSFKYFGPIRHKKGIASWTMVLIKPLYPEVKGVKFVTNRTRDVTDR